MTSALVVRLVFWLWFGAAFVVGQQLLLQRLPPLAVPACVDGTKPVDGNGNDGGVDGAVVANTAKTWADVNAALPAQDVAMFIPGTKHGTREVFDVKVLEEGCKQTGAYEIFFAASAGADDDAKKKEAVEKCLTLRTDGVSVDIDGDYTETLARIEANKMAIGVFGLSFSENNTNKLKVATINGVEPTVETISVGDYPVSRPLYFYVKKQHIGVIPGLKEYVEFFVSDEMAGPDGALIEYGLVPDPALADTQAAVAAETLMGPLE